MSTKSLLRLAGLSIAFVASAAAAAPVTSLANVRSGPGVKWPVVATIPAGADVQVLQCGGGWKRDWCKVSYGQTSGYVAAGVLAPSGNNVIVAPVVTTTLANLYKGPGMKYPVIAEVPGGATVNKGACYAGWGGASWCQVNYSGKVGYMMENLLQRQGALFPM